MFWRKLKVLIWKNYILRKRHWILTLTEIIIPTLMFILFAYARSKTDGVSKNFVNMTTYNEPMDVKYLYKKINLHDTKIYYAPKTWFTDEIVNFARLKLHILHDSIRSFDNEDDLISYHRKHGVNDTVLGVVYKINNTESIPKQLVYDIRLYERGITWDTDSLYHSEMSYVPGRGSEVYINEGFLPLQVALDTSYMEMLNVKVPQIQFEEFPYPPHYEDNGITSMFMYILPLISLFGYALILPGVLKRIIEEKSSGIKQLMKMMGLDQHVLWLSWFIHAIFVNLISVIIIVIFLKTKTFGAYPPIEYCNGFILFIFLLLYCFASISMCFFVSTFFSKPNIGLVFGLLLWLLSYFIPSGFINNNYNVSYFFRIILSIMPNMALDFGYKAISVYEIREIGVQWHNINVSASGNKSQLTMLNVMIMLIIDCVLYFVLTLYIDNIKPGPFGISKKWYYPLTCILNKCRRSNVIDNEMQPLNCNEYIEQSCSNPGIKIRKLNKRYGLTNAVNDLNMDIYEGEITVLLGHNGAGKTTTLSILTGMIEATSGTILIDDNDIQNNMDKVRNYIGICPQHDLMFYDLNVYEHLAFFAKLKGLSNEETEKECNELLKTLNLTDKKYEFCGNLSGGMKRKLCLGMALIGDPKVLVLDEPTSGLDVESRREIWNILLNSRAKKTTMITTHFMEEAEVLGDRIAIMNSGQLSCYGTQSFLKEKFGRGYELNLICEKNIKQNADTAISIVEEHLGILPESKINNKGITIFLRFEFKPKFKHIFKALENRKDELHISNMGLTLTSIEYVFLNVNTRFDKPDKNDEELKISSTSINDLTKSSLTNHEVSLYKKVVMLLCKQMLVFKRKIMYVVIHFLLGLLAVFLSLHLGLSTKMYDGNAESSLNINLSQYGPTSVYYRNDVNQNISKYYEDLVKSQLGVAKQVTDIRNVIIQQGIDNIEYYKHQLVIGGEFNKTDDDTIINVMYSNTALHGAPISWNTILNAYVSYVMNNEYFVKVNNNPLQGVAVESTITHNQSVMQNVIAWLFMFPLGTYIFLSYFVSFPQREYNQSIRHLQKLAGISPYTYWFCCFLFNMIIYFIYTIFVIFLIGIYKKGNSPFSGFNELTTIFTILMCYGISGLPFLYMFTHLRTTASALSQFLVISLFSGVILTAVLFFGEMSEYKLIAAYLKYLFSLLPPFSLTYMSVLFCKNAVWNFNWNLKTKAQKLHACAIELNPCCKFDEPDKCTEHMTYFNQLSGILLMTIVQFFVYFVILIIVDKCSKRMKQKLWNIKNVCRHKDVDLNEVLTTNDDDERFQYVVDRLKKIYNGTKEAVKNVSFKINRAQCYGLLGVNGAGKSSVFKVLVGDELPNGGGASIKQEYKAKLGEENYDKLLGYCPQNDALNYDLTGRELLNFFAKIRGVENVDDTVSELLTQLDLEKYGNVLCGVYSGGNKRKLNLALALVGLPLIQLLDEPTTGVDPCSRRKIWNMINSSKLNTRKMSNNKDVQPSILLTSHSMDECEVLCDELAIMKDGVIVCEGPIYKLKEQYNVGYCIKIKITPCSGQNNSNSSEDEIDGNKYVKEVKPKIENKLQNKVKLIDEHSLSLHYRMTDNNSRLSWLFEQLDELVDNGLIQDYNVSDATLEEVFLNVANYG